MSNFIGANKEDSGHRFLTQKKHMITIRGVICTSLFEIYQPEVYHIFQVQAKETVLIPNISEHQIYDDDQDECWCCLFLLFAEATRLEHLSVCVTARHTMNDGDYAYTVHTCVYVRRCI